MGKSCPQSEFLRSLGVIRRLSKRGPEGSPLEVPTPESLSIRGYAV